MINACIIGSGHGKHIHEKALSLIGDCKVKIYNKQLGSKYNLNNISKNDTDLNYNKAIIKCYKSRFNNNIIASHNHFSIKLAMLLNKNDKFIIANLKGMNERFMNNIVDIKKAEYIPYGEYSEMIPYLTRRLYENIDQIKYSIL